MKPITAVLLILMLVALACGFAVPGARAGDDEGDEKPERVAYLGVLTREADPTLRTQLGLPRGIGLVVTYVDPAGGAASALQKDDILLRLNDQALVNSEQFAVLVRTNQPGAEVRIDLCRASERRTSRAVLGAKEIKAAAALSGWQSQMPPMPFAPPAIRPFAFDAFGGESARRLRQEMQEAMERVREAMQGRHMDTAGQDETLRHLSNVFSRAGQAIQPDGGARLEVITRGTSSTLVENGETFTLKGLDEDQTHLTVRDAEGNVLFDGPVQTEKERERLPLQYRAKLEKLKQLNSQILAPTGRESNKPPP